MLCPYLLISINELLISIISFNDINKYGLNVKTAAHKNVRFAKHRPYNFPPVSCLKSVSQRDTAVSSQKRPKSVLDTDDPYHVACLMNYISLAYSEI